MIRKAKAPKAENHQGIKNGRLSRCSNNHCTQKYTRRENIVDKVTNQGRIPFGKKPFKDDRLPDKGNRLIPPITKSIHGNSMFIS